MEYCCDELKDAVKITIIKKPGDRLPLAGEPIFATNFFVHLTNFVGVNFYKYLNFCPFCGKKLEE